MSNKYIIHGATYNGDGTSSAEATADGGVGAWNTITYFEGTTPLYGTLAAGDVIYIRSKTAGGADVVVDFSGTKNLGMSLTSTQKITWVIDNGQIWSGVSGNVIYNCTTAATLSFRAYNRFIALTPYTLKQVLKSEWNAAQNFLVGVGVYIDGFFQDGSAVNTVVPSQNEINSCTLDNLKIISKYFSKVIQGVGYIDNHIQINNLDLQCDYALVEGDAPITAIAYSGQCLIHINGGKVHGTAFNDGQAVCKAKSGTQVSSVSLVNVHYPTSAKLAAQGAEGYIESIGADADTIGGTIHEPWGFATSRTDNYPPVRNALLPDAASTGWAYRAYPQYASVVTPMRLQLTKFYNGASGSKLLAVQVQIANTMSFNKDTLFVVFSYADATTGEIKTVSTKDFTEAALDSSSATWSSTTWGMISFNRYELSVTTPTSVKQDSLISATLYGTVQSVTANDILFVDPEFDIT